MKFPEAHKVGARVSFVLISSSVIILSFIAFEARDVRVFAIIRTLVLDYFDFLG